MKRCLVYNPFFPVLGGGERYTVALGEVVAETHAVTYAAPHGLDPERVHATGFPDIEVVEIKERDFPRASADYDLVIVSALYHPPPTNASRSIVVVQFPRSEPVARNPVRRWVRRRRLRRYQPIVYSAFARDWVRRRWGVESRVVHPPVELAPAPGRAKERLIVSVGRFVGYAADQWNSKRQDALIAAFSQLPEPLRASWRLVLVGTRAPSAEVDEALARLRDQAAGLNVSFETNVSPPRLRELLDRARFYWHATGFERPADEPERAEHFGISTVEAMSHGAIPMVYADGGQLEIVTDRGGRRWRTVPELVEQATALMNAPADELDELGDAARAESLRFGTARFEGEVRELLHAVGALRPSRAPALRRAARKGRWLLGSAGRRLYGVVAAPFRRIRARTRP